MKKRIPSVSVITVNYNGKKFLNGCFNSLLHLNYPKNKLEIFMVDNGSGDSSVEYVRKKFPKVKIIINDENNYTKANNLGIKAAKGEYLALINNDVKVDKNWLVSLIKTAQADNSIGAVGSKILFMDGHIQSVGHQEYPNFYWTDIGFGDKGINKYTTKQEVASICGCSVLYRKKCLREVGFFDEDFNMFMEDVDMSMRCRAKGWKLVTCPQSIIYHKFHSTIGSEQKARHWQETNRLLLIAKHCPEKLADALNGRDYFTVKNDYDNARDISDVLGKVFVKLIKEHGLDVADRLKADIFKSVHRIYNFEKDLLVEEVKNQSAAISVKEKELSTRGQQIVSLQQEIESLRQRHDQELNSLRKSYDQELSARDQRIFSLGEEIDSFWKKYNEDFASFQKQKEEELSLKNHELSLKNQELSTRDQRIFSLQQEIESLRQRHDQELNSLRKSYDQELSTRDQQISLLNNTIIELKQALADKGNIIIDKDKEITALNETLAIRNKELVDIYKSTGYRYILKPLWSFLWPIKRNIIGLKKFISLAKYKVKSKFIDSVSHIKEAFKVLKNINNAFSLPASNPTLKDAYLKHLKYNTFPIMPKRLVLMITRNCNLQCRFCDIAHVENRSKNLKKEDAFKIIDSAACFGIKKIILTGGEPLLHPQFFEIVDFANSRNIEVVLTTNGILIKANLERILDSKFFEVCISIDGIENTHDSLRNCKGAYKHAIEAIDLLKQHQVNVSANFVVTNKNIYELDCVYNYFAARNIRLVFFPVINKPFESVTDKKEIKIYLAFVNKLFRKGSISSHEHKYLKESATLYFAKKVNRVRCLGMNSEFGVDTDGTISPCCVWENRKDELNNLGNILKEDLEKLWFSAKFHKARVSIFSEGCENCFNPSLYELTQATGLNYLLPRNTTNHKHNKSATEYISNPNHIHFRFTSRCNLSCKHCDIWKGDEKKGLNRELSFKEWQEGIDKLHNWLGGFRLDLAGGEILLYDGAIDLIRYCSFKGVTVGLTTNATLIDNATAKRLIDSGLYIINLSLDGLSQNHDYTRNKKGAYSKVEEALSNLLNQRMLQTPYIAISTVITQYNLDDIPDLLKLVDKWGINGITFQALDHNFGAKYYKDWFKNNEFWPKDCRKLEVLINNLIKAKVLGKKIFNPLKQLNDMKKYYKDPNTVTKYQCNTGDSNFIVDEYGGVRLCWNMEPLGNILKQDPKEIWRSELASQKRKEIRACLKTCRMLNCNYL